MPSEPTSRWARLAAGPFGPGPARRCCSRRPGAAPWESVRRSRPLRARRGARGHGRGRGRDQPSTLRVRGRGRLGRNAVAVPSAVSASIDDVVAHDAVADRAGAAGIVAGHAADRRPRRRRHVDREPQAVRFQDLPVELVEDDARVRPNSASCLASISLILLRPRCLCRQPKPG